MPSPAVLATPSSVVSTRRRNTEPTPPRCWPSPAESGRNSCRSKVSGKRTSATSTEPNLIPPTAWPSPAVSQPSPAGEAPPPPRAWNMCQMNGRFVRGFTPLIAMRKRRDQPAMARSGHARASALMTASAISCAQWLVASVTGAGGRGCTIVPSRVITFTGRKVPEFFGVRGSMRNASAMCTEDIVLGKDEFTKPFTWGSEALRSTMRPSPFFVTVARIAMFSIPWPSSSRIASPRYVPSFQPRMVARAWRSAPSRISSTASTTVLLP